MKPDTLSIPLTALQKSELATIIQTIREQPHLAAGDLAAQTGWSFYKLNTAIRQQTGLSLKQLLREAAMQKAAWLLRNTHKPIKEIAAICGYKHGRSFHRRFVQQFQCTPARYRR